MVLLCQKTQIKNIIFDYDVMMMPRTPFQHPHWEMINCAKLDVCTPSSFGGSKTHRQKNAFVSADCKSYMHLLANLALYCSRIVTSSVKQN